MVVLDARRDVAIHQDQGQKPRCDNPRTNLILNQCISSVECNILTYHEGPFGSKRLREAMARLVNTRFSPASTITANEISFVSGVTALNEVVALCLAEEDEGLLLGMPIYGSFASDFQTKSKYRRCEAVYLDIH